MSESNPRNFLVKPDEVPFSFDELFFSRTDPRGIILSGNSVFQRISLYSWDEILRKPHNIIRHPDMPKCVFYVLWDYLKRGEPIGAYVKNRAKDGRYYWVFAIVTPVEGGFLSVRLKPSSEFMPIVEQEYKKLLVNEHGSGITPKESAAVLLEDLKALGFSGYDEFMSAAIGKEMAARDKNLGRQEDRIIRGFGEMMQSAKSLLGHAESIFTSYEKNEYVPLNLQIQSAKLGDQGRTIGVISNNYNTVSAEIRGEIEHFNTSAHEVFSKTHAGQLLYCTAKLQEELISVFNKEDSLSEAEQKREMGYLQQQRNAYRQKAGEGLRLILEKVKQFQTDCKMMKMHASSLEVIRIMGKVDSARIDTAKTGLDDLLNDLRLFQESIANNLLEIDRLNRRMQNETESAIATLGRTSAA